MSCISMEVVTMRRICLHTDDAPIVPREADRWERRADVACEMVGASQRWNVLATRAEPHRCVCEECGGTGWLPEYDGGECYAARCDACNAMGDDQ